MSRSSEFEGGYSSPAVQFIEWKSDDKQFSFYSKEKEANVAIKLPFKFTILKTFHTIKGFNDENSCGVYSNEVKFIGEEVLEVKTFKGGLSASGLYNDIKPEIVAMGGVYHKSIYCMSSKGEIINIALKGAAVAAFGEFLNVNKKKLSTNWVEVNGAEEFKKGKIEYSTPILELGKTLNAKEGTKADELWDELEIFFKPESAREQEAKKIVDNTVDDIPFD